ncbi:hypothetical protein QMK33_06600 [Hymenobacter sp. H14-R3]|uniref:hypothetical protein n=1 Tax=Hymenobacter sp. H14-R3 TaxID=3046308 RepID=UPI0024B91D6F|nr:hypothetical protein [Hymenobacter sp. H14-R3]MDJ0364816.1 hypothetical protein [Hymenobacter sp. H14-R3]
MFDFFTKLGPSVRQMPLYTVLGVLILTAFTLMGLNGYRLLGDDNESTESTQTGPHRSGGRAGFVHGFNHK